MAKHAFILLSMFALTTHHADSQFYDLFQGFQPYRQNFQLGRPEHSIFTHDFTRKRPQVDSYIRDDDSSSGEGKRPPSIISNDRSNTESSRTTSKPSRRRKTTTPAQIFNLNIFTTPRPVRKNKSNSSQRHNANKVKNQALSTNNSNRRQFYDDSANNVADYNTRYNSVTTKPVYAITRTTSRPNYADARPATSRPNYLTTKNYYDNSRPEYNSFTTQNPLYNRPGVKPAVVDSNKPPITNRPATARPIYNPTNTKPESPRPANVRPDFNKPVTTRPELYRPATTRPFQAYPKPTDSSAIRYPEDPDTSPEMFVGPDEDKMSNVEKRRYLDLAERMCDQYKLLNVKKVEAIPLVPSPEPVQVNVSVCPPTNVPLVVGGKVVTIEEFPHMALLGWTRLQGGGYSWKCGGSLISDQYVLTAGHCAYQEKDDTVVTGAPRVVQLGSSYLDDTGALVMRVLSVVTHPKYVQTRSYYDIALVKMVRPVTFSQVVKPACLGEPPGVGEPIIATGWGRTEFGGSQSTELRSVSIPVWDMDECSRVLGTSRKLPDGPSRDSQICAGERNGGKDTCQGDSGGPAQIQDGCAWRVVAVTSVGRSCGAANTPALYATLHRPFIAAQVFGKLGASQNNRNENNNHQNVNNRRDDGNGNVFNNNRDDSNGHVNNNNRRDDVNVNVNHNSDDNNGNVNNNFNSWNSNAQNNRNDNRHESGVVNNNENWNNNQQTNNNRYNTHNEYSNSDHKNFPVNTGYSVVTEGNNGNNYNNNNREHNSNYYVNRKDVNDNHKIVYPQEDTVDFGNTNNKYGPISYTTHRSTYNSGWWSGFSY